jgi:alkylation response protein AidB-like acyl-CoA dehydrogenase
MADLFMGGSWGLSVDLSRARCEHALAQHLLHGQHEVSMRVGKIVRAHNPQGGARARVAAEGPNRKFWKALGDAGLLRVAAASSSRTRPGPLAWMTVMEEFGLALVDEPFIDTVVGAAELIHRLGSPLQREMLLPPIAEGSSRWAVAHQEVGARNEPNDVITTARRAHNGYFIQGAKAAIPAAPWADRFIVSARTSGARRDPAGVSLFVVDACHRGVGLDWTSLDEQGPGLANLTLSNVYVDAAARLGEEGGALPALESARAKCIAALCAEAVGATAGLIAIVRRNSAVLAAAAVQGDRWNDMLAAHEDAAALTRHFSARLSVEASVDGLLVSRIKSQVGYVAGFVLDQAGTLIPPGSPDGAAVARYGRRILSINRQHGDPDFHHRRVCEAC